MQFWSSGVALTAVLVMVLLSLSAVLRQVAPGLGRLGIPSSILAGLLGLLLGASGLNWLPLQIETLESIVYHGLALVFIALALVPAPAGTRGRSMAFAIPLLATLQGILGLGLVIGVQLLSEPQHPGLGLLLPLGFNQGPGQALSLGQAWESSGLERGGSLGLIIAALGYLWAIAAGLPLVHLARKRGWLSSGSGETSSPTESIESSSDTAELPGALDPLTRPLMVVGSLYALTWWVVSSLAGALEAKPQLSAMIWGFHFLVGLALALAFRAWLSPRLPSHWLQPDTLRSVAGAGVDVMTCAALAAVQLQVFRERWVMVIALTTLGGLLTLSVCLWLARRAFPEDPFEHGLLLFGMTTGTLPTGLALLRIVDPQLRGPASVSAVTGAAGALVLSAPLLLFLLPYPVAQYPDRWPIAGWEALGGLLIWSGVLLAGWRLSGGIRFRLAADDGQS